jgi:hypothetical protein
MLIAIWCQEKLPSMGGFIGYQRVYEAAVPYSRILQGQVASCSGKGRWIARNLRRKGDGDGIVLCHPHPSVADQKSLRGLSLKGNRIWNSQSNLIALSS